MAIRLHRAYDTFPKWAHLALLTNRASSTIKIKGQCLGGICLLTINWRMVQVSRESH